MKITREKMDTAIALVTKANTQAALTMLALETADVDINDEIMVPYTVEEVITVLKATKEAYGILSELRESL